MKLSKVGPHLWEFAYSEIYDQLMDEFDRGCEYFEEGELLKAEKVFKSVLARMPDHLDAIHHLAMVQSEQGSKCQARDLWEQSVRIGRKAFPPEFARGQDRLEWGYLDNRPFLRCLHGLALIKYQDGEVENSFQLFQELLSLNPNDNQGVRALATEALYELGRFEDVIELTNHYRNDMMSETLYGRAIAFFKLGREREASVALNKAMKYLPLIGKELLKKRHRLPKTARPNRVTVGGADEAYYYWEHWGKFWIDDSEVFKWLRGHIGLIELGRTDRR